jgi:hypothetical protein
MGGYVSSAPACNGNFLGSNPVPEIIDPVFAKTSPKRSFCMTENERFGLVFVKTGSINSGADIFQKYKMAT